MSPKDSDLYTKQLLPTSTISLLDQDFPLQVTILLRNLYINLKF